MSGVFQLIKNGAKIGMQLIKEKTGAAKTWDDPEFENAIKKLKILQERFDKFKDYTHTIVKTLQGICYITEDMTKSFDNVDKLSGCQSSKIVASHQTFFTDLKKLTEDYFVGSGQEKILDSIKEISNRLDKLSELKDAQRQSQLLCYSYRDKLANKVRANSPEEEIQKYQMKYDEYSKIMDRQTESFKSEMNVLWDQRFILMEQPMDKFVEVIFSFCFKIYGDLNTFQGEFTTEELYKQFEPEGL